MTRSLRSVYLAVLRRFNGGNKLIPGGKPMDSNGHGIHVAGIIAAQPNPLGFTGAVAGVTLGAYRMMGCKRDPVSDVIVAAFNKAFEDGANIITLHSVHRGGRGP
ncbi:hypothetical protein E4U61_007178 [Claviceps capensis]|nr:hypothetical protein E4U61_007178 [Claviceps capensis]